MIRQLLTLAVAVARRHHRFATSGFSNRSPRHYCPPARPPLRDHRNRPPRLRLNRTITEPFAYLCPGLELPDDVVPGLAMGFTVGVAVGMAVGEGIGEVPGAASELVPARIPEFGVGARIPEGIPGAAGRTPSGLASVDPVLFGAGPAAEGRLTEPPC